MSDTPIIDIPWLERAVRWLRRAALAGCAVLRRSGPLQVWGVAWVVLMALALGKPSRPLGYFDQGFYATAAWDLVHWGVYSNGIFDAVDSYAQRPQPGMFLGPLYPALLALIMLMDPWLQAAADCMMRTAANGYQPICPGYRGLVLPIHMAFVATGIALQFAAIRRLVKDRLVAAVAAGMALLLLGSQAKLLMLAMTESLTLGLVAALLYLLVRWWQQGGWRIAAALGGTLGLLILARPSYTALIPALLLLLGLRVFRAGGQPARARDLLGFLAALALCTLPWAVRNALVLDHFALTADYGTAALAERLAFDRMSWREWAVSFVFWLPDFGDNLARALFGAAATERLDWNLPGSLYHLGMADRMEALATPGGPDAAVPRLLHRVIWGELGWYLMVTLSLAWRGVWVGRQLLLLLVPFMVVGLWRVARAGQMVPVLVYAGPALFMLGVHAAVAVNQERYNLSLSYGFALLAAWGLVALVTERWPWLGEQGSV